MEDFLAKIKFVGSLYQGEYRSEAVLCEIPPEWKSILSVRLPTKRQTTSCGSIGRNRSMVWQMTQSGCSLLT
jgi:hypothetical protein